jgi:hypothetical protein
MEIGPFCSFHVMESSMIYRVICDHRVNVVQFNYENVMHTQDKFIYFYPQGTAGQDKVVVSYMWINT